MSLKKFFLLIVVVTVFALVYVQMQVTIFDLAYKGKSKEDQALRLSDSNVCASLNIAKLKSARSLGGWYHEKSSEVDFVNEGNIVEVKTSASDSDQMRLVAAPKTAQNAVNALARFFSLKSVAEAEPVR